MSHFNEHDLLIELQFANGEHGKMKTEQNEIKTYAEITVHSNNNANNSSSLRSRM